jgi:hypothetical protein
LQTGTDFNHFGAGFQTFRQNLGPNGFVDGGSGVLKNVFKEVNAEKIDLFKIQGCMSGIKIIDTFIISAKLVSHLIVFIIMMKALNELKKTH